MSAKNGRPADSDLTEVMTLVFREIELRNRGRKNAPGHCQAVAGIWDRDNGELAGQPCAWCALWNKAKAILAERNKGGSA